MNNTEATLSVITAVLETIEAHPQGMPSGALYALLMEFGCTSTQFSSLISLLTSTGAVREEGHLLFIGKRL